MKVFVFLILSILSASLFGQTIISPELQSLLNTKSGNDLVEINIFFKNSDDIQDLSNRLDTEKANHHKRIISVVNLLKTNSENSFGEFYNYVVSMGGDFDNLFSDYKRYWGVNMLNAEVSLKTVNMISESDIVRYVDVNSQRYRMSPGEQQSISVAKSVNGAEPGLKTVNAHELWAMGYTGRNILFLSMDTGVIPDHPAISDNFSGNHFPMNRCWYGVRSEKPADHASSSHGTHTTGTVLGLDRNTNDTIGVAFNAMWIASDPVASSDSDLLTPTDFMDVFQWVFDPDGNLETSDDVPKVVNNSWGYDYSLAAQFGACEMVEAEILIALEVAGICSPFSAGNDGPGASTIGFPAMRAFNEVNPMAIGALQQSGSAIASFSSRGPTPCIDVEGPLQIKPEVSAPGVAVRSSVGNNGYNELQGTSMACPHVSGVLLLLAEAFPTASAYELKYALYNTAIDLGDEGEDNVFGRGLIDALAAYNYLAETYSPEPPVTNEFDLVSEIISPNLNVVCPDQTSFNAQVKVSNSGTNQIDDFNLMVFLNDMLILDSTIITTLDAGEEMFIETENYSFYPGENYIHSIVRGLEDYKEFDVFNNADISYFYIIQEENYPYETGFDQYNDDLSDLNWLIQNPDNLAGWENLAWGDENQNKALGMDFGNYGTRNWEDDYANLPIVDLPDNDELFFSFTYAYKKRVEYIYKDSLILELSLDCGETFPYQLWRSGGEDMATVEGNAGLNLYVPQTYHEFDTIDVDISEFKGERALLRFVSLNDRGSALYIDFVRFASNPLSDLEQSRSFANPQVFPNPTNDYFTLSSDNQLLGRDLKIIDVAGTIVKVEKISQNIQTISVDELMPGLYFVLVDGQTRLAKLIISE